jgi:protein FAM50
MGDFGANFNLPSTGIHTVEGNVAGSRAAALSKQREAAQLEFQKKRSQIKHESQKGRKSMDDKFDSNAAMSFEERMFRSKTVGLVSAEDFKKAQLDSEVMAKKRKQGLLNEDGTKAGLNGEDGLTGEEKAKLEKKRRKEMKRVKKKRAKMLNTLSFADAEDADDIIQDLKLDYDDKRKSKSNMPAEVKKDPNIDTSFLPDKERENRMTAERQRLKNEWIANQNKLKEQLLEITYSYWDGSGHRRTVNIKKGDSIAEFLEQVRKGLAEEFREMANASSDALLYIKEDLIIPQDITFYDLIVTKARGKSGPLFNFDVHDDIRVGPVDHRVEKDESHPGKVVERSWYEKNKHIFPASRWETYDPIKEYGKYTIHGGEKQV